MKIKRIKFQNYTAFEDQQMEFSPGINVIIGENGTGKTHLMKALYSACSDTEKFVKAIRESQSGAERFTAQAYQDVLEKYNTKAMAKQYSEKYDEAINIGGGGTA